jgi:hypothetical protein
MKIFFSCTTLELVKYKDNYLKIRDIIIDQGHILTRDWLPSAIDYIEKGREYQNPEQFYKKVINALHDADLVIVEDTVSNFSTGFVITHAIQKKKPILVLRNKRKNKHFKDSFLDGIDYRNLDIKKYKPKDLDRIIRSFIAKYENAKDKNRFHLVIDGVERKYLDWIKHNKSKSRTKVIRNGIRRSLSEDKEYQRYLGNQ